MQGNDRFSQLCRWMTIDGNLKMYGQFLSGHKSSRQSYVNGQMPYCSMVWHRPIKIWAYGTWNKPRRDVRSKSLFLKDRHRFCKITLVWNSMDKCLSPVNKQVQMCSIDAIDCYHSLTDLTAWLLWQLHYLDSLTAMHYGPGWWFFWSLLYCVNT